ncbi:MAG TPA: CHASE3 domain-containing protein, partial [Polyangia bacterium]
MADLKKWTFGWYALCLLLLIAVGVEGFLYFRRYDREQRQIREIRNVSVRLEEGLGAIVDAESDERGYLLTGDPSLLRASHRS